MAAILSESPVTSGQNVKRQRALESLSKLPPFSPIMSKLLASMSGEDVSFIVLGELIEKDAVMAGNILKVVNSAAYSRQRTVNSVRYALSVLGIEKVRNTVLAMSISRMLHQAKTPQGWSMERFNKHSSAVAILSDLLAQHVSTQYPEGAFVAGLLHDVGWLLIAMGLPTDYVEIQKLHKELGCSWMECEMEVLGFSHADLSGDVMARWKLPEQIREAILSHHSSIKPPTGGPVPLTFVLRAADAYVNAIGNSVMADAPGDLSDPEMMTELGLNDERRAQIIEAFTAEYTTIAQYYH